LSSRSGRATATFFYVSRGSTGTCLRHGAKYYIYFADNSLLLPTIKEFSKSVNTL